MTDLNQRQAEIDILLTRRQDLKIDINRVTHHIEEERALNEDGPDPEWMVRARHSRRKMEEELSALGQEIYRKCQDLADLKEAARKKELEDRQRGREAKRAARREAHEKSQALLQAKAAEKRKKQEAIDAVRERIFIDKAREILPKEIYFDIWRQVDAEQPR